jgi:transcriptional regulator with XRE-family HTH domain
MYIEKEQIEELIQNDDFRSQFTADFVHEFVSAQIRALREKKVWSQAKLGQEAGRMEQTQVSRLENPEYSGGSLKSLIRIAQAFDVGLLVRFVPFSKLMDATVDLTPDNIAPPSFREEDSLQVVSTRQVGIRVNIDTASRIRDGNGLR